MRIRTQWLRFALRLMLLAAIALLPYVLGPYSSAAGRDAQELDRAPGRALSRMVLPGTQDLQLIVQLSDPSIVEYLKARDESSAPRPRDALSGRGRLDVHSTAAHTQRQHLSKIQNQLIADLLALPGARIEASLDTVINAVIVRVPVEYYNRVRGIAGVKKVYFSRPQKLLLDTAASIQNAQGLWSRTGGPVQAGRGIKIGIIDTGIDNANPMFVDGSLTAPPGYPKSGPNDASFTSSKVIVARNYVNLLSNRQSVRSAVDEQGHGTFVAGVAAGKQVDAPLATINGMAPGAYLGNYKIFGTPGVNDGTTTAAVIAAINDAVADGMDVLNLSLGGLDYALPADDPEIPVIENAINSGVVVVLAAGNDGPGTHTISNPGGAPDAITVGSVSNSRTFVNTLRATAPAPVPSNLGNLPYLPGNGPAITVKISSTAIVDVQTLDGDGWGCGALPAASLSGRIAFILRGNCSFASKVGNATSAGATAVVIYNNDPSGSIISMDVGGNTTIPAVMISNPDGLNLKSFINLRPSAVQIEIDSYQTLNSYATTPRVLSSFSAVGPAPDFGIKPDMVAVGENVYSAAGKSNSNGILYDPSGFTMSQGTSFSSPMVAGAAAGLRQLFPGLNAFDIKSLLTSTASRNLTADGVNPPSVVEAGSGLLDMGSAASASAVFSPTSLNFGVQSYTGSTSLTRTISIRNISSSTDQYTLSSEQLVPGAVLSFSQDSTGAVSPDSSTGVNVTLQVTAPLTGGFQGFVTVTSSATSFTYRIPYWAGLYVPDASRKLSVSQTASGTDTFSNLPDAIAAARPGNIIEIADSGTYAVSGSGLVITTNAEGLPLHGLVIRAAAGQSPIIDGSSLVDSPTILVVGIQNALLQGVTIKGGQGIATGVQLVQPSKSLPLSATIDHCNILVSNASALDYPVGIWIDGGGTIDVIQSTITIAAGTGIVATQGAYLTLSASSLAGNGIYGMEAFGANIQVLNSTVSNNSGPGMILDTCTGTIDGSTFASNLGFQGDGIEIWDGNFTITDNTFDSNGRLGIGFYPSVGTGPGPIINFTGNTVRSNKDTGVYSDQGQDLRIDGNLIEDNARGMRLSGSTSALVVNNIVVRSTSSTIGNGVEVAGTSKVRLVNNTIYKNAFQGIVQSSTASAAVFNSIVSSNARGDIQGLSTDGIQFSLVSDRTLSTGNNITGDPKLVNPDADNFELAAGSPALEAGSNSIADLPYLDFNRRLRVSSAGSGISTGDGTVDLGAIESNANYPLVFPLLANGSQEAFGDSYTTGIAVLNPGASSSATTFAAYAPSGGFLGGNTNPAARSLGPQAQLPILGYQLFGFDPAGQTLGSLIARSVERMSGFFLLFDTDFKRLANGTSATDQAATDLIFMRHEFDQGGKATIALFNPGVNDANITANLYSFAGTVMDAPKSKVIPAKGQYVFGFNTVTASSGYVRVQSDRPVSGLELVGNTQALAVMGAVSPGSEARLFFPHIALNQGYTTQVGMVNSNLVGANITLTAYGNDGQVLGTPKSVLLPANGQLLQSASDLFGIGSGALTTGYVIAQSDQAGVQGFAAYRFDDGAHQSTVASPVDSVPRRHLLFSHIAHQVPAGGSSTYQTGIALLNPFGTAIDYSMRVFDSSGKQVAQGGFQLGPRQKVARLLSHPTAGVGFFTQPISLSGGHVEIESSYGLIGFELFFTEDLSQLASVPAQIGN